MKSEYQFHTFLLCGSGNPCFCLVLHLHISGRWFGANTPYGASPHIHAFYLRFVRESQTTVHKQGLRSIQYIRKRFALYIINVTNRQFQFGS